MKSIRDEMIYFLLKPFGKGFSDRNLPAILLLKCVIIQKVLRVNSHVPWAVHWSSKIKGVKGIERGSRWPGMGQGCNLDGRNGIVIGENTWIGPKVSIISQNHDLCDYTQYKKSGPIVIGKNSWLATGCFILAGVELGEHTVVAAGAVVTKSMPKPNQLIGGNPARIIKNLDPYLDKKS